MHFTKVKGILSPGNGMNLYRGCSHGCIYCDSRSRCYQINHDFEDIEVKENAVELLEKALIGKRKKCMIATGSMTDPYIPLELTLEHTKKALLLIEKHGFGLSIQTKSDRILRDINILESIHQKSKCVVSITLTTFDDKLCKILEPNVCVTSDRIRVLHALKERGIPAVVWLSPILPFINDTEENILAILDACAQANVYGVIFFGAGLTLREGNREYFYQKLDEHFPGLKQEYAKRYGFQYEVASPNNKRLSTLFHETCEKSGLVHDNDRLFAYFHEFPKADKTIQLSMWDNLI
ncbi:MAG: radical SAM protein [Clostridia bacterium]|nr:radical SAM protein [Clostridia bacterium]